MVKILRMVFKVGIVFGFIFWFGFCAEKSIQKADLVLMNAKIITVDKNFSFQEAVAVKGQEIIFKGTDKDVQTYIDNETKVINLNGKIVLPGLIDAHAHMNSLGNELASFNINKEKSFKDIVQKASEFVKNKSKGEWVIGGRWNHSLWEKKEFPVHDKLSEVTPDNPMYLSRIDGNSALVNQKALDIAGITKDTPDPEGGKIIRKKNGEPTGVLVNRALNLVKKHFPEEQKEQWKNKILRAVNECVQKGLTGWHEAGSSEAEISWFKELIDQNKLKMRVYAMLGEQEVPVLKGDLYEIFKRNRLDNYKNYSLSVRSIKLFFDGALGSRGAAFYNDYADDPGNKGLFRISPDYIYEVSKAALKAGMGVNTHCIGIRGNRACLDSYIKAIKETDVKDHRFRIEHSQIVRAEDVLLFKNNNIIPSMQPTHCTSDKNFVSDRVGEERCEGAYAWRWFIDAGLTIPCGSDFPVESNNPFFGIYAAVSRQDKSGSPEGGWHPEQMMSREEAIKGFTIWAAHAAFQEKVLGSIEVGKLADFTVIDRDILTVPVKEIIGTKVLYTIVGGKIMYKQ